MPLDTFERQSHTKGFSVYQGKICLQLVAIIIRDSLCSRLTLFYSVMIELVVRDSAVEACTQ